MSDEELVFPVVIVGAGGTGLCAALAAADLGADVLVLERDASPMGSTAMSTGLIPAAGTPEQAARGIKDSPELFATDISAKAKGLIDFEMAHNLAHESGDTVAWLRDEHDVPLALIDGFTYPGHSALRMYGTPNRTGGELMAALESAAEDAGVVILTDSEVTDLEMDGDRITALSYKRPDGVMETVRCEALILACSGFGGEPELIKKYIPEMAEAVYHGHPGNKGDALRWAEKIGAATADLTAYQGHGGLAFGHGIPILWPLIMQGGFQVNSDGKRFSNEASGYSEQAAKVNAQPGHVAWSIYDERLHNLMLAFDDYRDAQSARAFVSGETIADLCARTNLPADSVENTVKSVEQMVAGEREDEFGREFTGHPPLSPPYYAAKVTGALFHTQGGIVIDNDTRVLHDDGRPFANLFAGGGAARGVSGSGSYGYLAGNGLLTATTLGKLAGRAAARLVAQSET